MSADSNRGSIRQRIRWLRFGVSRALYTEDERTRIERLARYNGEKYRGLRHTEEWRELMAGEQVWFNEHIRTRQP